jgi:hypothetical protein
MNRPLNVLHVCDHLGWNGSRMHGVKRLFAWIIPRLIPTVSGCPLVSLRKRDLSEETLDALGVDITTWSGRSSIRGHCAPCSM